MKMVFFFLITLFVNACVPVDSATKKEEDPKDEIVQTNLSKAPRTKSPYSLKVQSSYSKNKEVIVYLTGFLPNPCSKFNILEIIRKEDTVNIKAEVTPPPMGTMCAQYTKELNEPINIGSFKEVDKKWKVIIFIDKSSMDSDEFIVSQ